LIAPKVEYMHIDFTGGHMKSIKAVLLATVLLLVPGYALASDLGYMRIKFH